LVKSTISVAVFRMEFMADLTGLLLKVIDIEFNFKARYIDNYYKCE